MSFKRKFKRSHTQYIEYKPRCCGEDMLVKEDGDYFYAFCSNCGRSKRELSRKYKKWW